MSKPYVHAFNLYGDVSEGARIALDEWCQHCVSEHVAANLEDEHIVQWYGEQPQRGDILVFDDSVNGWVSVSGLDTAAIADLQRRVTALEGGHPLPPSTSTTTTTRVGSDLTVDGPDGSGNYAVSGTSVTGPDVYGNFSITSAGVSAPDSFGDYALAST